MADIPGSGASLNSFQAYIRQELFERGFDDETVAQKFMLFIEEVGELAKAARKYADIKVSKETTQVNLVEEFGDVLILYLDLCNKLGISAEEALIDKETKNKKRSWT